MKVAAWSVYDRARERLLKDRVNSVIASYSKEQELSRADGFEVLWTEEPAYSRQEENKKLLFRAPVAPLDIPAGRGIYACPPLQGRQYLAVVKGAILAGAVPFGITGTRKLLTDTIDYNRVDDRIGATLGKNIRAGNVGLFEEKAIGELTKGDAQIKEACLLFSSWNHYGHWLPEHALKLRKLEDYEKQVGRKVKVIVEKNLPGWKREILALAGWEEEDILRWEGRPVKVERLVLPSYPEPAYRDFLWLKDKVLGGRVVDRGKNRRLYITRKDFKRRFVVNEEELYGLLADRGFEVIRPERLSVKEQAALFAEAEVVCGPHGSGFTNLLYADRARVMEMFAFRVPLFFYRLSLVMGHRYRPYYCPVRSDLEGEDPMLVDRDDFKRALEELVDGD